MKGLLNGLAARLEVGGAILITSEVNRRYLTDLPCAEGWLLADGEKSLYLTDFRYGEEVENFFLGKETAVSVLPAEDFYGAVRKFADGRPLYVEDGRMTVAEFQALSEALPKLSLCPLGKRLELLRAVKSEEEIARIAAAQNLAEQAFLKTMHFVKVGMTEREFAAELLYEMQRLGAEGTSFDTIVASGVHSSVPHAMVSDKKFEPGDIVTVDFGARLNGYCSDTTRNFVLGKPNEEQQKIYNLVLKAQKYALANIRAGMSCREADSFARETIAANGYGDCFGHSLGHGLGLEIHEAPRVSHKSEEVLQENMVISVEPGIYLKNNFGVRIENIAVVRAEGLQNLTNLTQELLIV